MSDIKDDLVETIGELGVELDRDFLAEDRAAEDAESIAAEDAAAAEPAPEPEPETDVADELRERLRAANEPEPEDAGEPVDAEEQFIADPAITQAALESWHRLARDPGWLAG